VTWKYKTGFSIVSHKPPCKSIRSLLGHVGQAILGISDGSYTRLSSDF